MAADEDDRVVTAADTILNRLLALRRHHERRALEDTILRDGHCRRAQQQIDDARDAIARHLSASRINERRLIGSVLGRTVSQSAIGRLQAELDVAAAEQDVLRAAQASAQSALREHDAAREAARAEFRRRQHAVIRLDHLLQRRTVRDARRRLALAEAADDDRGGVRHDPWG
jgi:chromosome segregation ATPase